MIFMQQLNANNESRVIEIAGKDIESKIFSSDSPVVAVFESGKSGTCYIMLQLLDELASEFAREAKFFRIDVDKSSGLTVELEIRTLPSFLYINRGKIVARLAGITPKSELKKMLTRILQEERQ
jgi:thioredoxin